MQTFPVSVLVWAERRVSSYAKPNCKKVTSIWAIFEVSTVIKIDLMVFLALKMEAP